MSRLSAVDIAIKQRHLLLLQKIKQNKPLTSAELRELKDYEEQMNRAKTEKIVLNTKVAKTPGKTGRKPAKKSKKTKAKKTPKRMSQPLRAAAVKLLALECSDMTEADEQSGLTEPLAEVIKKYEKLGDAWRRGCFLRELRKLAAAAVSVAEAEEALGLEQGRLKNQLEEDKEVASIWNSERLSLIVSLKEALVEKAKEGSARAISQIESLLKNEIARPRFDMRHVPIAEMTQLTGYSRQSIHKWHTENGLPRNADKTYDLVTFFRWFDEYSQRRQMLGANSPSADNDPLRTARAKMLALELDKKRGDMLDRQMVIAGLAARQQNLVNSLDRKAGELSHLLIGKSEGKIKDILNGFFTDCRRQQCSVPEFLQLADTSKKKFSDFMDSIDFTDENTDTTTAASGG